MTTSELISIERMKFQFRSEPHLRDDDDWHTAYARIIEKILKNVKSNESLVEIPAYPLLIPMSREKLLFEMGAFWEGSLYFICKIIGARTPLEGIKEIELLRSSDSLGFLGQLFLTIWNSHGQLKWLKAHYIRENAIDCDLIDSSSIENPKLISKAAKASKNKELAWLAAFVDQHFEEGSKYPNPYFGGTNPLHLGMILTEFSNSNKRG